MTEEKLLELLENNFKLAIKNNEFDEFIDGINKYLIVFKDSYDWERTSSYITLRGIENVATKYPDFNVSDYVERQLINMLQSNNIENTYGVLSFIIAYKKRDNSANYVFNINLSNILPLLKSTITKQKQEMEQFKNGVFNQFESGMYNVIQNMALDFDDSTTKIL